MTNKCIKICSVLFHCHLHENVNMKRTDKDDKDVEQLKLSYNAVVMLSLGKTVCNTYECEIYTYIIKLLFLDM